jgi:hypothetical protein
MATKLSMSRYDPDRDPTGSVRNWPPGSGSTRYTYKGHHTAFKDRSSGKTAVQNRAKDVQLCHCYWDILIHVVILRLPKWNLETKPGDAQRPSCLVGR